MRICEINSDFLLLLLLLAYLFLHLSESGFGFKVSFSSSSRSHGSVASNLKLSYQITVCKKGKEDRGREEGKGRKEVSEKERK